MENNEFKPLSWWKELLLKNDELANYYLQKREYEYKNKTYLKGMKWRELLHPVLLKLISFNRKYIDKQTLKILNDKRTDTGKPVIYAITHIGMYDYQLVGEAIKDHQYPFAGDPETMYRTQDGLFLSWNGIIYCDTESKTDRKIAKETAIEVLKRGDNLLIYPEGIWNVTPNLLTLPLFPGVIDIAMDTNCDIIPVAIEQYDKDFIVNIGSNFTVNEQSENREEYVNFKKDELRDQLATLKMEIMESREVVDRDTLGTYKEEYDKFAGKIIGEWVNPKTKLPYYNKEIIKSRTFKLKKVISPEDAFNYLNKLEINKNTAFCFRKDSSLPNEISNSIDQKLHEYLNNTITNNKDELRQTSIGG